MHRGHIRFTRKCFYWLIIEAVLLKYNSLFYFKKTSFEKFLFKGKKSYICKILQTMLQIEKYRKRLTNLCHDNTAVDKIYFFGSVLSPLFNEDTSDVDVLVEVADLPPEERGENLIALWDDLEALFGRKVDLLTENSLRNPFLKKEVERTKKLFYDRQSRKILV